MCIDTHTHTHTHKEKEGERDWAVSVFSYSLKSLLEWPEFFLGSCSRLYGKLSGKGGKCFVTWMASFPVFSPYFSVCCI